jgi:hypothetical protein
VRRRYRSLLPVLARYYSGWDWTRIEDMPAAEIDEFLYDLQNLLDPP